MKKSKIPQQEKTKNLRTNQLSLVAWALIHNTVISPVLYLILMAIDFAFQIILIICIYTRFKALSFDTSQLEEYIDLHSIQNVNFIQDLVVFSICFVIVLLIFILMFRINKNNLYQEKNLFFKCFSAVITVLRTFLATYFIQVIVCNFENYQLEEATGFKYAKIVLTSSSLFLLILITYFSGQMFVLAVPNDYLPWSETSSYPYFVQQVFKVSLCITYTYRNNIIVRYTFVGIAILSLLQIIGFRIRRSYIFNKIVFQSKILMDSILLHLLIMILPAELVNDDKYYAYVLGTLPIWLLFIWFMVIKLKVQWIVSQIDSQIKDTDKIINFLQLLDFFLSYDQQARTYLYQLQYQHYLRCRQFSNGLDHKLERQKNQLIQIQEEKNMQTIHLSMSATGLGVTMAANADSDQINKSTMYASFSILNEESKNDFGLSKHNLSAKNVNPNRSESNSSSFKSKMPETSLKNVLKKFVNKRINEKKISMQRASTIQTFFHQASINQKQKNLEDQEAQQNEIEFEFEKNGSLKRDKEIIRLLKHYFKYHFIDENTKDYKIHLLKAYFTQKILKNDYLTHFLMFDFIQKSKKDNFIQRNIKLLHQKLFEEMISTKNQQGEKLLKLDLANMLDLNQLIAKFEASIEGITEDIFKFWQNLYNEKDAMAIYGRGIGIADQLNNLQKLYTDIDNKQGEKKEIKMYIQMAAFYKYVVFKSNEYYNEMQKSQQIFQMRKIANEKFDRDANEKGLLLVNISFKKPMRIKFINKQACNLIGYDKEKAVGLVINNIMPQIIAENHHKFLDYFMATGKFNMINQKRHLFLKKRTGYILPVTTYLFLNQLNPKSMILLLDPSEELKPFEETEDNQQFGVILCDKNYKVYEISNSCFSVCKLSHSILTMFRSVHSKDPCLDDLFQNETINQDFDTPLAQGFSEIDVTLKYKELVAQQNDGKKSEIKISDQELEELKDDTRNRRSTIMGKINSVFFKTMHSSAQIDTDQLSSIIMNATMTLKFTTEYYMNKNIQMKVIYIKLSQTANPVFTTGGFTLLQTVVQHDKSLSHQHILHDDYDSSQLKNTIEISQELANLEIPDDFLDGSSGMSSVSSTASSLDSILKKYDFNQHSLKGSRIPITLKIVLQIVLLVFFLITATSTISLILIQSNFSDAIDGIHMSNLSIARLNCITQTRLLMRVLVNIVQGYNEAENEVLPNRFEFYSLLIEDKLEELRQIQVQLNQQDEEVDQLIGNVKLEYLTSSASFTYENRSISQAVNIYISYGNDLIQVTREQGPSALWSYLVYFYIPVLDIHSASVIERKMYFIIQNGNQDFYFKLNKFAEEYIKIKSERIESKVTFSTTMTWICVGVIFLSGLAIIPLFGKIQDRIRSLMSLFFLIDKETKANFLNNIEQFVNFFKLSGKSQKISDGLNQLKSNAVNVQKEFNRRKSMKSPGRTKNEDENKNNIIKSKFFQEDFNILPMRPHHEEEEVKVHEDEESSDGSKDQEKRRKRKHHKRHHQEKPQTSLTQIAMIDEFEKAISKKKIIQSFAIVFLLCCFQSYFIGNYFMSKSSFQEMSASIDVIFILFGRKACGESVIHAIEEGYQWNDTYYINNGQDEIMEYFTTKCFKLENDYQHKIRKQQPQFLEGEALDYINLLENGDFCEEVFSDGDGFQKRTVTPENCATFAGGITLPGLTNIYQTTYKVCQQLKIEYQTAFETNGYRGPDFIYPRMRRAGVYLDVLETILTKPQSELTEKVLKSLDTYFGESSLNFIVFFSVFMLLTASIMLLFFCNIFKKLKKEMLLSNKLLYIVDFEILTDTGREQINQFFTKY